MWIHCFQNRLAVHDFMLIGCTAILIKKSSKSHQSLYLFGHALSISMQASHIAVARV
jgi:hypothetical protein